MYYTIFVLMIEEGARRLGPLIDRTRIRTKTCKFAFTTKSQHEQNDVQTKIVCNNNKKQLVLYKFSNHSIMRIPTVCQQFFTVAVSMRPLTLLRLSHQHISPFRRSPIAYAPDSHHLHRTNETLSL